MVIKATTPPFSHKNMCHVRYRLLISPKLQKRPGAYFFLRGSVRMTAIWVKRWESHNLKERIMRINVNHLKCGVRNRWLDAFAIVIEFWMAIRQPHPFHSHGQHGALLNLSGDAEGEEEKEEALVYCLPLQNPRRPFAHHTHELFARIGIVYDGSACMSNPLGPKMRNGKNRSDDSLLFVLANHP